MAVDEGRRHQLYRRLEEVLGQDEAGTLMDHLPPLGWADVARRSDIEGLRRDMDTLERRLSDRFNAKLESKLNSQTKTLVGLMTAQVVAVAGLAFAAARLT
ncbi:MAG: hypothetical protein ACRDHV_04645 [Actinomycetota bacterium]